LKASLLILVGLVLVTACETQPSRPLSPLESCLDDARSNKRTCALSAAGSGRTIGDATSQRNSQICQDRYLSQEDRCYARFNK
jgi:hypothetical protein